MFPTTVTILVGFLAAVLTGQPEATRRPSIDRDREPMVKAGMVLNFIRYTEWPTDAFAAGDSPIVVTVLEDEAMSARIEETVKDQNVHNRPVTVRRLTYPTVRPGEAAVPAERLDGFRRDLRDTHVLFIGGAARDRVDAVLADLGTASVLTVSEVEQFAERGGMIRLTVRNGRIAFDANPDEIQETRLKVSSHLLRLARVVGPTGATK